MDINDIRQRMDVAGQKDDAASLVLLAAEAAAIDTPQALYLSWLALGSAHFIRGQYSEASILYDKCIRFCSEQGDLSKHAKMLVRYGHLSLTMGSFADAHEQFNRALEIYHDLNINDATLEVGYVIVSIGEAYKAQGDFSEALNWFYRALEIWTTCGDRHEVASTCISIGATYMTCGFNPEAQGHFYRALGLYEELGVPTGAARAYHGLCNVLYQVGDFPKALEYGLRAKDLYEAAELRRGIAGITDDLGLVYYAMGSFQRSLDHYRVALALHDELGNSAGVAHATGNIIEVLLSIGEYDEASVLIEKQSHMTITRPDVLAMHHVQRSRLLLHHEDVPGTEQALLEGLQIAIDGGVRPEVASIHALLRDLAERRNDLASYIKHNKAHQRVIEEIRGRETTQRLTMIEAERQMDAERRIREKEQAVLYSTLPRSIAERIVGGEKVTGDHFGAASVIFLDIVNFTRISDSIPPGQVVYILEQIFSTLDSLADSHNVTKIKTIGDSYMAVAFGEELSDPAYTRDEHAHRAARFAIGMLNALTTYETQIPSDLGDTTWVKDVGEINVRIGLHCGPVTAGVIGTQRLQYDVWGDTVNVASRMESSGLPGHIQVSQSFAQSLGEGPWNLVIRGPVSVKGKGDLVTYWLKPVDFDKLTP